MYNNTVLYTILSFGIFSRKIEMRINVKILKGPDCSPIVSEETSVRELKVLVANELDIPVERQRLVFKGKPMHDNMSLVQYGVTNDSRVILSVKDADSNASSTVADGAGCSVMPELNTELTTLLLRHFTQVDAERVAEEFKQDMKNVVCNLSLDDIERIAKVNVEKTSS